MALKPNVAKTTAQGGQPPEPHQPTPNPTPTPPPDPTKPVEAKSNKSIVPSKYTSRYKNGGEDPLAQFIKQECASDDGFSFDKFFELCAKNGIAQDKVDHYKGQVREKRHGAQGRARMTLRNMLATIVRKNGKAVSLNGSETAITLPKAALTGAAKKAADKVATDEAKQPAV